MNEVKKFNIYRKENVEIAIKKAKELTYGNFIEKDYYHKKIINTNEIEAISDSDFLSWVIISTDKYLSYSINRNKNTIIKIYKENIEDWDRILEINKYLTVIPFLDDFKLDTESPIQIRSNKSNYFDLCQISLRNYNLSDSKYFSALVYYFLYQSPIIQKQIININKIIAIENATKLKEELTIHFNNNDITKSVLPIKIGGTSLLHFLYLDLNKDIVLIGNVDDCTILNNKPLYKLTKVQEDLIKNKSEFYR